MRQTGGLKYPGGQLWHVLAPLGAKVLDGHGERMEVPPAQEKPVRLCVSS